MLAGGYSWRLYFYVEFAFATVLLILAFFFVEETSYKRKIVMATQSLSPESLEKAKAVDHVKLSFLASPRKYEAEFFMTMARSFTYFLVPSVLWVVTSFGKPAAYLILCVNHPHATRRHLYWSGCACVQLHFPNQDRRPTLQLESGQSTLTVKAVMNDNVLTPLCRTMQV